MRGRNVAQTGSSFFMNKLANKHHYTEVLVVARGGGSKEDLECFNNPKVAKEIFRSVIPVATGIGHQIDESICDLVADRQFITPTAVAQGITQDRRQLQRWLQGMKQQLLQKLAQNLRGYRGHLLRLHHRFQGAMNRSLHQVEETVAQTKEQGAHHLVHHLQGLQLQLAQHQRRFLTHQPLPEIQHHLHQLKSVVQAEEQRLRATQDQNQWKLESTTQRLTSFSQLMDQGMAMLHDLDNNPIKSQMELQRLLAEGSEIRITFPDGAVQVQVQKVVAQKPSSKQK